MFTTQPAPGHFRPLLPFARALAAAGHEVTVACARAFRVTVESEGLRCFEAGLDYLVSEVTATFPDMPPPGPDRPPRMRELWRGRAAVAMAHDLLRIAETWRPDLIVHEGTEFGASLAAERLGVCNAAAGALWFRRGDTRALDSAVAELGCATPPGLYDYLALAAMPPSWIAADDDLPPTVRFVSPVSAARMEAQTKGRPLVHATMGTTEVNQTPGIYEAIIAGLRGEVLDLVVATGNARTASSFGEQPSNVRIEAYVEHAALLPRCDVVVTHGGHGTLMGCLALGVPVVVIPVNADQPRNAERCEALGVGRVLRPHERTADAVRDAVRRILGDSSYRESAMRLRTEILKLPDDSGVGLLETLGRRGR